MCDKSKLLCNFTQKCPENPLFFDVHSILCNLVHAFRSQTRCKDTT